MKTIKEYDVMNRNGVIVCQVCEYSPKDAQKTANKLDSGLTVSKRGRRHGIVFDAINARTPIHRGIA